MELTTDETPYFTLDYVKSIVFSVEEIMADDDAIVAAVFNEVKRQRDNGSISDVSPETIYDLVEEMVSSGKIGKTLNTDNR